MTPSILTHSQQLTFLQNLGFKSPEKCLELSKSLSKNLQNLRSEIQNKLVKSFQAGVNNTETTMEIESQSKVELLSASIKKFDFTILTGQEDQGKTHIVQEYIETQKIKKFIRVYITKNLDLKTFIGNYICSEKIGEFEWKDGPISAAYKQGYLLILENLQEAKEELFEMLFSAIEGRLQAKDNDDFFKNPDFKVLGTWRTGEENFGVFEKSENFKKIERIYEEKAFVNLVDSGKISTEVVLGVEERLEKCPLLKDFIEELHRFSEEKVLEKIKNHCFNAGILQLERLRNAFVTNLSNVYGRKNPKNFSLNFKFILIHDYFEIYFGAIRQEKLDEFIYVNIAKIFDISAKEIINYLANYDAKLILDDRQGIRSTRVPQNQFSNSSSKNSKFEIKPEFIKIKHSRNLLEKILKTLNSGNNLLLVGKTGCGKTTAVQETANYLKKKLYVYNMSQSSDVGDLIGGYRPLDAKSFLQEHFKSFCEILEICDKLLENAKFVSYFKNLIKRDQTVTALKYLIKGTESLQEKIPTENGKNPKFVLKKITKLLKNLKILWKMRGQLRSKLIFKYIKGNMVNAIRKGDWILLDEINLAQTEILNYLAPILEGGSINLLEKGKLKEIPRHPDFRIIACMNPGNTVGKKELDQKIRKRFIEFFVPELENSNELQNIVLNRSKLNLDSIECEKMTNIYLELRELAKGHEIEDGFGRVPWFTLRSLCRAVDIATISKRIYTSGFKERAIFDGVLGSFGSNLDEKSKEKLEKILESVLGCTMAKYRKILKSCSKSLKIKKHINIEGFLLEEGPFDVMEETEYLLTPTTTETLKNLLRVISHSKFPILLEGPTSAGKTSIIRHICQTSGNRMVRINNHHHTDLDEYIGSYSPDNKGRLIFKKGLLVEAMIKGYWLVLDEINLAKSEILEALNRLLDDNRELYVPEINTLIKPHKNFRVFATQNPITYGGRKELSAAFRSRFMHFYFQELKSEDLIKIVEKRCDIPNSRAKTLVKVMHDLSLVRSRQNFFAGKESLITVRDLLKWGSRDVVDYNNMALEGTAVLVERLRHPEEKKLVKQIIEKICIRQEVLDLTTYHSNYANNILETVKPEIYSTIEKKIFWSENFKKMFSLTHRCLKMDEPCLLIGETGCGKTTVAQLISKIQGTELFTINCHRYTESSDFIGSLRPKRNKEKILESLDSFLMEILDEENKKSNPDVEIVQGIEEYFSKKNSPEIRKNDKKFEEKIINFLLTKEKISHYKENLQTLKSNLRQLFEWIDGPLTMAMKTGSLLLIDEISLAQDSVLERLNPVLERNKSLTISEKGDGSIEEVKAKKGFGIIATMNPSGDFGKRELSQALRNRFTEVWVQGMTELCFLENMKKEDSDLWKFLVKEIENLVHDDGEGEEEEGEMVEEEEEFRVESLNMVGKKKFAELLAGVIFEIVLEFNKDYSKSLKLLTLRDIKSSLSYLVKNPKKFKISRLSNYLWILFGGLYCEDYNKAKEAHLKILNKVNSNLERNHPQIAQISYNHTPSDLYESQNSFGFGVYRIKKILKNHFYDNSKYSIGQKAVAKNLERIIQATSIKKSILLEGPPGVGKTSLITFLAKKIGIKLYRINLSEQTDLIDLLGSDVPSDGSSIFQWADGALLKAMKEGSWLLLDELNMANQTVLEGLNSILDHRGSIYLPELDQTVVKNDNFRIFGSQNPMSMGSGRKGLPKSFLSRFTRIWLQAYDEEELRLIVKEIYPEFENDEILRKMINFFFDVKKEFGDVGSEGWEFNLRDLGIISDLVGSYGNAQLDVEEICKIVILNRMSDEEQRRITRGLFKKNFGEKMEKIFEDAKLSEIQDQDHLDLAEMKKLNKFITEPLVRDIEKISEINYPILFMKSEDSQKILKIEDILGNMANEKNIEFRVLSLFSTSDTVDLIGSFEQVNFLYKLRTQARSILEVEFFNKNSKELFTNKEKQRINLLRKISKIQKMPSEAEIIQIRKMLPHLDSLINFDNRAHQFIWQEAQLIKSLKKGDWVLIKGAESVNPAVLERLNAFLEQEESVSLNECLGEKSEILKGNGFKMFIEWNLDKKKEVSRALRNRCIEIKLDNFIVKGEDEIDDLENFVEKKNFELFSLVENSEKNEGDVEEFLVYERFLMNLVYNLGKSGICENEILKILEKIKFKKNHDFLEEIFSRVVLNLKKNIYVSSNFDGDLEAIQLENEEDFSEEFYSSIDKETIVNNKFKLILSIMMEILTKFPKQFSKFFEEKMTNIQNIDSRIINTLEESTVENYMDTLEVLFSLEPEKKIIFLFLIISMSEAKFTFKRQSEALLDIFRHNKWISEIGEKSQNLLEEREILYIKSPKLFLMHLLYMLSYSNDPVKISKFVLRENSSKDSSLGNLFSQTSLMKLRSLKNSEYNPVALKAQNLKSYLNQNFEMKSENLKNLVNFSKTTINENFENMVKNLFDSFMVFEIEDDIDDDLDGSETVIYIGNEKNKEISFWRIFSKFDDLESLIEDRVQRMCIDLIKNDYEVIHNFSKILNRFDSKQNILPLAQQLNMFWRGNLATEGEIGSTFSQLKKMVGIEIIACLKAWNSVDTSKMKINEISIIREKLNFLKKSGKNKNIEKIPKNENQGELTLEEIKEILDDLKKNYLTILKNPDIVDQSKIINLLSLLTQNEKNLLELRLKIISENRYESILTKPNLEFLRNIHEILGEISLGLQQKKIRSISEDDLTSLNLQVSDKNEKNLILSEKISKIIQKSFFKKSANPGQNVIDTLEKIIENLELYYTGNKKSGLLLKLIKTQFQEIFAQIARNGDIIVFNDILLPIIHKIHKIIPKLKTEKKIKFLITENLSKRKLSTAHLKTLNFFKEGHEFEIENLIQSHLLAEETALILKAASEPNKDDEDKATKYIKLNKQLEDAVVNEYTKEAVEENKRKEKEEIREIFGGSGEEMEFRSFWDDIEDDKVQKKKALRGSRLDYLKKIYGVLNAFEGEKRTGLKEKERIEMLSSVLCLEIGEINETIFDSENLKKFAKKRFRCNLEDILDDRIFEISNLSIFAKMQQKNFSIDFSKIWKEQILQLIELDEKGFYNGSDHSQLLASQKIFNSILLKLKDIRQDDTIGDLPIITSLINASSRFLSLKIMATSLNRAADKLQHFISLTLDFEGLTPKKYHFEEKNQLIDLLSQWRKKERKTWRTMLSIQNLDIILNDMDTCIKFKNSIYSEFDKNSSIQETKSILSLIENFLRSSKLFSFIHRLNWTQLVLKSIPDTENNLRLKTIGEQIIAFYSNFAEFALEKYRDNFKDIDRPIREIEKLSNWHMKDFVNLKMNIQKFRRGLHRAMRHHREILEMNAVNFVIEAKRKNYLSEEENNFISKMVDEGFVYQGDIEIFEVEEEEEVKDDVQRLLEKVDPSLKDKKNPEKVKKIEKKIVKVLGKNLINKFVKNYYKKNGDFVDSRVLSLLIKDLRIIQPHKWMNLLNNSQDVDKKNEKNENIVYKDYSTMVSDLEVETNEWFKTVVELKERKNHAVRFRALNSYIKGLKSWDFETKKSIASFDLEKNFSSLENVKNVFERIGSDRGDIVSKIFKRYYAIADILMIQSHDGKYCPDVEDVYRRRMQSVGLSLFERVTSILRDCRIFFEMCENVEEQSKISDFQFKGAEILKRFLDQNKEVLKEKELFGDLASEKSKEIWNVSQKCEEVLRGVLTVSEFKNIIGDLGYDDLMEISEYSENEKTEENLKTVEEAKRIILSFSKLIKTHDEDQLDSSNPFDHQKKFTSKSYQFLKYSLKKLKSMNNFSEESLNYKSVSKIPIQALKIHFLDWCYITTKFAYLSIKIFHNLIYKGFCSEDQEEEEEVKGEDEYDFGTGAGEGQGDENTTDNYEFEEQVLGQKQDGDDGNQENQDNNEIDDNNEDEAMEMENDFDGTMDEQNEKEQEENEKKGEELDQEFDNVDQDDLEKKLWNEENEEMEEEDQEEREERGEEEEDNPLREEEEVEFEGERKDEREQRAKEEQEKDMRQAEDDYKEQKENEGEEDQDKEQEELADVEDASEMSEREIDENMDFDDEEQKDQAEDDKGMEEEEIDDGMSDMVDEGPEENEGEMEKEEEGEWEDPLEAEERKMEEEEIENKENEDALSEKGVDVNNQAEDIQNEEIEDEAQEKNVTQGQKGKEEDEEIETREKEEEMRQEAEDGEENKQDLLKDNQRKELEEFKKIMEDVKLQERQDREEVAELDADMIDAVEQADEDDEAAFNLLAPKGMNMDSKKEEEKEANTENMKDKPVMKLPEHFQPPKIEKNQQEEEVRDNLDMKEEDEGEEEEMLGKRTDFEDVMENFEDSTEKKLKKDNTEEIEKSEEITKEKVIQWMKEISNSEGEKRGLNKEVWAKLENSLRDKASYLAEELRAIFKPTKIAGMKGDYRTGKRLNMRKVIGYVASNYRKDKIWLRRSDPSQKDYQIILGIDDSLSMT